ncbi:MAG: hypothetical protein IKL84_04815 [Clostridia bacterium]|nr:hypothetical protein [Clostridia bacterium]
MMKQRAFRLMKEWCDTLLTYQVKIGKPDIDDGLLCPACQVAHGRVPDLCFPLTVIWAETGLIEYLEQADRLINWADRNLQTHDGLWRNDATSNWICTSAFAAMSIGEAIDHFGDRLPEPYKSKWMSVFRRIMNTVYTFDTRKNFRPVSNYYCGIATALAMAWRLTGEGRFYEKSKYWLNIVLTRFDANGLLYGEGPLEPAADGSHTVDMGYNLEESIPLLLRYAEITGEYKNLFRARLRSHLEFLLPDGAIDNSFGSRHNKWTYWGSRTSDGLIEGLALVLDEPMFADACVRVLTLYEKCTHDGLLAMPMAHEAAEPTCLHHTFTHAKALAALVCAENIPAPQRMQLPCEKNYGVKQYQNGRLLLVSNDRFRATFSTIQAALLPDYAANAGGSMNLLYHPAYGVICAATSAEYLPSEPLNQQYLRNSCDPPCMTAQFIVDEEIACRDKQVNLSVEGMCITASAAKWQASYTVSERSVDIALTCKNGIYQLPVVCAKKTPVTLSDDKKTLAIGPTLTVTSDTPLTVDCDARVFHQVGGLLYLPVSVNVQGTVKLSITVTE